MWSSFTINSPDPPALVRDRLAAALTTAAPGWLSGPPTFQGAVEGDGFWVVRNLALMERTLPIVATGRFVPAGDGTEVRVTTRPQWWAVLALCGWTLLCGRLLWGRLASDPLPGGAAWVALFGGFVAFGWGLLFVATTIEERTYRDALAQLVTPVETGATADRGPDSDN